jgi:uncharacterized protein (TIGR01244 family)
MIINQLSKDFSATPQITVAEVQDLAARGFKTIVCGRPDSEVSAGETSQDIKQAAAAAGMSYHHLPLVPGELNLKHVEALRKILKNESGQVLGYCRTGGRAASLWAFVQADTVPADQILSRCASCGYNLESLRPTLESLAAK